MLYVDDMFITGNDTAKIRWITQQLCGCFEMSDLGPVQKFLGLEFLYADNGIYVHQATYAEEILRDFGMDSCSPSHVPLHEGTKLQTNMDSPSVAPTPYSRLTGKLNFYVNSRPDLPFAINTVSRFMQAPQESHEQAARGILRYIRKTAQLGLFYAATPSSDTPLLLTGYSDADWASDVETRRSTGGYLFTLNHTPITWSSKRQASVATSSTESEYRALMEAAKEADWLKNLLLELQLINDVPTTIFVENQSTIRLVRNPVFHQRIKHFELHYHYSREQWKAGTIDVSYLPTTEMPADILTKVLGRTKFELCRSRLKLLPLPAGTTSYKSCVPSKDLL